MLNISYTEFISTQTKTNAATTKWLSVKSWYRYIWFWIVWWEGKVISFSRCSFHTLNIYISATSWYFIILKKNPKYQMSLYCSPVVLHIPCKIESIIHPDQCSIRMFLPMFAIIYSWTNLVPLGRGHWRSQGLNLNRFDSPPENVLC